MRSQLTCVWCAQNNTFAATAFSSYGAFWMGFGMFNILDKVRRTHSLGACSVFLNAMAQQALFCCQCCKRTQLLSAKSLLAFLVQEWPGVTDNSASGRCRLASGTLIATATRPRITAM